MNDLQWKKRITLIASCICISACLQIFQAQFIYWRYSFFSEIWRWWTAHWVHVGWIHFLLNIIAFACFPFIFPHTQNRFIIVLLLVLAPLCSLTFYYLYPNIEAYAGLSGILHGLYVAAAFFYLKFRKERNFALLVLFLVMAKLAWENTFGQIGTAQLIGSPVLVEAHLVGAFWGAICAVIYLGYQQIVETNQIKD
ncbi:MULTISPECIES: rhombosortase [unclassified Acinetobacter]|uniref:rhombosortase n=1 Tax=unclassified Acinetobacter TaxID=196816 RepID=UPI0025791AA2|nr:MULTISPECIES: rhombosortase [unclassified Acinetobacter]MDM1764789.1 rhombosortase [Acinetobacter sp. 226-1]MDM1768177.1 rhombosortase [Acinetobacter sp. 226-4]